MQVVVAEDAPMNRSLIPVIAFTAAYLLIAAAWIVVRENYEFLAYIAFLLVLAGIVWVVHRRVSLPLALIWCLSLWGAAHMAGGLVPIPESWPREGDSAVLYNLWLIPDWLKFDQLVHAYGFGITTWLCWEGLRSIIGRPDTSMGVLTQAAAAGTGFGALNEVVEFTITLLVPDNNVGGYFNTAMDLVFNLLGAVIAALLLRLSHPPRA